MPIGNHRASISIALLATAAALLAAFATPFGVGISPDSVNYFSLARSFSEGRRFSVVDARGIYVPNSHFPPGYPTLLATFAFITGSVISAGRLLTIFSSAMNVFLTAVLALELRPGNYAFSLTAGLI